MRTRIFTDEERKKRHTEASLKWKEAHGEKEKEFKKKHYLKYKNYYENYRENYSKTHKTTVDKQKKKTSQAKWRSKNPDRIRAYKRIRKACMAGNINTIVKWEKSWRNSHMVRCYWCNGLFEGKKCHTDHIVPLSKGGPHSIENLCISCFDCNVLKNSKSLQEWNKVIEQPVLF